MNEPILWSPGVTLDAIERMVILKAFEFFKKNKTATSQSLGISIRTLENKLDRYEVEAHAERERQYQDLQRRKEWLERARGNPPNNQGIPYSPTIPSVKSHTSAAGIRLESVVNASAQSAVPVPERKEVQSVLSKPAPQSGKPKRG